MRTLIRSLADVQNSAAAVRPREALDALCVRPVWSDSLSLAALQACGPKSEQEKLQERLDEQRILEYRIKQTKVCDTRQWTTRLQSLTTSAR